MAQREQVMDIVEKAFHCDKKVSVSMVTNLVCGVLKEMAENDDENVITYITTRLGTDTADTLICSIIGSIIGSLYISANFGSNEIAVEYAKKCGVDKVITEEECEERELGKPEQA